MSSPAKKIILQLREEGFVVDSYIKSVGAPEKEETLPNATYAIFRHTHNNLLFAYSKTDRMIQVHLVAGAFVHYIRDSDGFSVIPVHDRDIRVFYDATKAPIKYTEFVEREQREAEWAKVLAIKKAIKLAAATTV